MKLMLSILMTLAVGAIAGFATASNIDTWYALLKKPFFNPPNWVFAPVWTLLYLLMGIAFYLIWKQPKSKPRNMAIRFFFFQLFLNFLWSFLFFEFHHIALALFDIIILWVMILLTIILFSRLNKPAGWMLIPYLCWVGFATLLNVYILNLNVR
ncbi:MAG: tryptophan-rich sensory protein [Bacteroidetes bacterium]|jgi:translocator protein|nr:tryptophan-rich sensory protein [Bacteroidota bacterium]